MTLSNRSRHSGCGRQSLFARHYRIISCKDSSVLFPSPEVTWETKALAESTREVVLESASEILAEWEQRRAYSLY